MINFLFIRLLIFLLIAIILCCDGLVYVCDKNSVPCGCGQTNVGIQARIVNGENSLPHSWPMIVSLRRSDAVTMHFCGGTILSESYVLTAAHCVNTPAIGGTSRNLTIAIAAGVHNLSEANQIIRQVDKIIIHPLWITYSDSLEHDIAILHLAEPLYLGENSSLSRTCLPPRQNTSEQIMNYPSNGTRLVVVGWGSLALYGDVPDILQQVTVNSIHHFNKICSNTILNPTSQFCAGLYEGGKGTCSGDSGGPIFQWIEDRWEQVGIVSYSDKNNGCSGKGYPAVYTRISYFYDWIQSQIFDNNQTVPFHNQTIPSRVLYSCRPYSTRCGCSRRNVALSPSTINEQGEDALPHTWSMIVSIRVASTKQHICSGTILENFHILTAAHCLTNRSAEDLIITAGMYHLSETDVITRQILRIFIHPNYTAYANQYTNNIAILKLSQSVDAYGDRNISRTCVSSFNYHERTDIQQPKNGTRLVLTGWNITNNIKSYQKEILQQMEVYVLSDNQDQLQFNVGRYGNSSGDICNSGSSVTYGDPIFQWIYDQWIQVGLASYCSTNGRSAVFNNLANYSSWIKSTLISSTVQASKIYRCDKMASCDCGQNDVNITISGMIGSEDAIEHSWPMIVSIQFQQSHSCAGSILSDSFILTSCTCVANWIKQLNNLTVVAAIHNISGTVTVRRRIDQIYLHPNYKEYSSLDDIAIVHLNEPLPLDTHSSILTRTCLPKTNTFYPRPNTLLVELGWNKIVSDENRSSALQQISIESIDDNDPSCRDKYSYPNYEFCARGLDPEIFNEIRELCLYTAGGPVLMYLDNHWEQVGIISSLPYRCDTSDSVKVYTRLSSYFDWINSITSLSLSSTTYGPHTIQIENTTKDTTSVVGTTSANNRATVDHRRKNDFLLKIFLLFVLFLL